jgi:hypothetical protein
VVYLPYPHLALTWGIAMSASLPSQSVHYLGHVTDTDRWAKFQHRSDDIFICTPWKCGTTWTQAIVCMLIFGRADHGEKPGVISPWIDADFAPIEEYLEMVDAQSHRRFIKTHSPLDGLPYFSECTYLVVFRDPRDMYFSMLNHRDNLTDEDLAFATMPSGNNAFQKWLDGTFTPENFDVQSLEGLCQFLQTYWDHKDLPNIHIYHYADMKRDLRGHIQRVTDTLGIAVTDSQLEEMTVAAPFETMQKKSDQFAPMAGSGAWKSEKGFFASGKSAQWKDKLSEADLAAFESKMEEMLTDEQIAWLVRG